PECPGWRRTWARHGLTAGARVRRPGAEDGSRPVVRLSWCEPPRATAGAPRARGNCEGCVTFLMGSTQAIVEVPFPTALPSPGRIFNVMPRPKAVGHLLQNKEIPHRVWLAGSPAS